MKSRSLFYRLEQRNRVQEVEARRTILVEASSAALQINALPYELIDILHGKSAAPPHDEQSAVPMQSGSVPQSNDIQMHGKEENEVLEITEKLCSAAKDGNVEALAHLLSTEVARASIIEKDASGRNALYYAVRWDRIAAIHLLVESGADVNVACGSSGGRSLTYAAKFGREMSAVYLLSKGACKETAIQSAEDCDRTLVEGFFVELERIIKHGLEFKAKREELKAVVQYSEKSETLPTTSKGITIAGLRKIKALIQSECESGRFKEDKSFPDGTECKGTMTFQDLTTTDVVYRFVKDEGVSGNLRLIDTDLVKPEHKSLPNFFISHAWKGRISKLLDVIFAYVEEHGLSDETAVWIDVFSVNQHGSKECSEFSRSQNQADVASFKDVVQTCIGGTLVVCDFEMCVTSTRAWCLYEWDWTMFYHGREKLQFLGLSSKEASEGKGKIDVESAQCFMAADKEMILTEIVKKHGSTQVFNGKLKSKWIDVQNGVMKSMASTSNH